MKKKHLILFFIAGKVFAQETEKPFIKEHEKHKHKLDFVNAVVFQSIKDYSTFYGTSHLFFTLNLDKNNLIFVNTSVSFGNGLNKKLERLDYSISSTADDLEDSLMDINGTGRKYLLEAFYQFNNDRVNFTAGLIDSTAFIDSNKYANDEHIQFLNSTLVNNPTALLPSYHKYKLSKYISFTTDLQYIKQFKERLVYGFRFYFEY